MSEENLSLGWIKLHRSFIKWEWFDTSNMVTIFIYCLLKANHKDNKWRGILIKRGTFVTSLKTMSNETHLSIQSLRTGLKRLEKSGEINKQSNKQNTVITICNYDSYQEIKEDSNKQNNKQLTNEQQTTNKQVTTNKNDKNKKNEKNIPEFDVFLQHAISKKPKINKKLLRQKYDAWIFNDWKDGNNKKINNWKLKLNNTLSYIAESKKQKITF